jgi:beta-glucosidase
MTHSRRFMWPVVLLAGQLHAQGAPAPDYLDPARPAEQRARDLVGRMTLAEKASQLVNQSRAIPRLDVPAYDWWSEALHGVARDGTTEFPEPIGLASTFDAAAIHRMAIVIGTEARIKHVQAVRDGHSDIFEGLDFWAPNINIFRDPRWGRGQETYGEDPFLSGRLGVAFVTGMQGDDSNYYRVIATPKHFAVHSGPEPERHRADIIVSRHDELDTYLPAFRAAVVEGKAASIMCAYNSVNGQPACANEFLLQDQLRGKWHFQGYVVSDCEAIVNIFRDHHFTATQAEASALALQRGMDNECVDFGKVADDHDFRPYLDAHAQGKLREDDIDTALVRLFTARIRLGMFDPPGLVPYSKIDERELDNSAHRAMARQLANESMVLLKNDGTLPLRAGVSKIAVVGPLADQTRYLLGNYAGMPSHIVSVLDGLKAEFPAAHIRFVPGTLFLRSEGAVVPGSALTTAPDQPGLSAQFFHGEVFTPRSTVLATRQVAALDFTAADIPAEVAQQLPLLVEWRGYLEPQASGDFNLGVDAEGAYASISVDGHEIAREFIVDQPGAQATVGHVHLEQGKRVAIKVVYARTKPGPTRARLIWSKYDSTPDPAAIAAAQDADVVVAVLGITSQLEGEEMAVNEAGFQGGDRTRLDLPEPEQALLQAVTATGKPVVLVLANGSALAVNWANQHVNAILEAWYAGEEGGAAVAETLSGRNNPAGRLPVTFYTGVDQLPAFDDYSMRGRTYRYFTGRPLFPFGYGLSYTKFAYGKVTVPSLAIKAGEPVTVSATVTNVGKRAGDEVAQLYLSFPPVAGAPLRALRGFERIHLAPGESKTVRFVLQQRDQSMVTAAGRIVIAAGTYAVSVGGGQPDTGAASVAGKFRIAGSMTLPE